MKQTPQPSVELCVNLCETVGRSASSDDLERIVGSTCLEAGFPYCERVYAGSYFCENFFCHMGDAFNESLYAFCERHDVRATLVVPIAGQAFLERMERRLTETLERSGDLYDEIVVNDIACFHHVRALYGDKRIGLGRLFSKEMRDARIDALMGRRAEPSLSAEALECLASLEESPADGGGHGAGDEFKSHAGWQPLVELDPVSDVVDVSGILEQAPGARIAMHVPYCFATTGRNCGPASIDEHPDEKFRLGRGCSQHCLRMDQGYLTEDGARYLKQGRTFFFENPTCSIVGTPSWRIVYQAGMYA